MMFSSCLYSSVCSWKVSNLLYQKLIAEYLCCEEGFDMYGMIVSVKVGFL
jgi:hypothetical protein